MIPIFVALDTASLPNAMDLLEKLDDLVEVKIGLEFFIANGPEKCKYIQNFGATRNRQLFLDLKLHDIPNTVGKAIEAALPIEADFISVHSCEDREPLKAAVAAANKASDLGFKRPKLLGVTFLTSLPYTSEDYFRSIRYRADDAYFAGFDGLVSPPNKISTFRTMFSSKAAYCWRDLFLMVPSIRSKGSNTHDQKNTMTPREAMDAGASALVIGREITDAADPRQATLDIIETMR